MHDDLVAALHADHEEVLAIVTRLQESGDLTTRKGLLEDLLKAVLPHMVAEEQVIYPALRPDQATWADAREAIDEHHDAQAVLQQMVEQPAESESFADLLKNFSEIIEEHIRFEEETIFPDLKRILSERHAAQSLEGFRREKDLARRRYPDLPIVTAGIGEIRT